MKLRWHKRRQHDPDLNTLPLPDQSPYTNWQTTTSQPIAHIPELASHYIKPQRRRWLLPVTAVLLVCAMIGGGAWIFTTYRNTPSVIFNQAIENAVNTQHVKQHVLTATSDIGVTFDLRNMRDLRTTTLITKNLGVNTYIKGYGSMQNTYFSYTSNPLKDETNTPTQLLDRWINMRTHGTVPTDATTNSLATEIDPRCQLLGTWIVGKFDANDQKQLLKFVHDAKVYEFDSKKVSKTTIGGQTALAYEVVLNKSKLAEYNRKAARLFGISASDTAKAITTLQDTQRVKFFINPASRQVIRTENVTNGIKKTIDYSDYGKSASFSEPRADLTYTQYLDSL